MRNNRQAIDKTLFLITICLVGIGFLIFFSASLGLYAKDGSRIGDLAIKQILIGGVGGLLALMVAATLNVAFFRKAAFWIFCLGIILNLLLLIPGLGITSGGATRWLSIAGFSFQPSEVLRLGAVLWYGVLLHGFRDKIQTFKYGLLPLLAMLAVVQGLFILQRDTDPISAVAIVSMFFVAGGRWRDILIVFLLGLLALGGLIMTKPYLQARIQSFIHPDKDSQGSSYQITQSLIALGSGGALGRGFGQSVQKFEYLPEPMGDSIFAVAGEEFGFIGTSALVGLYLFLAMRIATLAAKTEYVFGRAVITGILVIIIGQSFMNIGAMIGILPLTGVPLAFVSQGGTALLTALAMIGVVLSLAREKV